MHQRTYGVAGRDTITSMDGLSYMEGVLSGALPSPPMARTLNIGVVEVAKGVVTFEGAPTGDHLNPMNTTHGGWYGGILDSALGCAVMTTLEQGSAYTTLEYRVNLTRGVPEGMLCRARATVDHAGRTTAVARAELRGVDDGKLYGTASTTCLIMRMR